MSAPSSPAADGAPRPRYGEYATPEQQRAAIGRPDAPPELSPATGPRGPLATQAPRTGPVTVTHATTRAARPSRTADRVITIGLLAYGLFTVISAVPQLWFFTDFAEAWMKLAGIEGTFTNIAQGDVWGRVGAGVFVLGWLLTALASWRALRRGRLAWWIPPVGAIASFLIVSVCLTVPLLGDPAIVAHLTR